MSMLLLNKEVVNYYKELKGIKYDSDLLRKIGIELGYNFNVIEAFIKSQKGNFSKIVKGIRTINKEYIIPLEKIFGVPIAKLVEPDAYTFLINKDNIPYLKGIKYYAYMDDMDLYKDELLKITDVRGNPIICNPDEFGKTFLDYVVEYNSVNAIKFLYETFQIKLKWYHNFFYINDKKCFNITLCNSIPLAKMIANMNDDKLFFNIYDTYNMFVTNGHYGGKSGVYEQDEFLKIILDNEHLFKDIFRRREYLHICTNLERRSKNLESYTINTINPIIIGCLRYAINNLEKYKDQAIRILDFAIMHNKKIIDKLGDSDYYIMNDLGGIFSRDENLIDLLIYCNSNCYDIVVKQLIEKLPKNENGCFNYYKYKNMNS